MLCLFNLFLVDKILLIFTILWTVQLILYLLSLLQTHFNFLLSNSLLQSQLLLLFQNVSQFLCLLDEKVWLLQHQLLLIIPEPVSPELLTPEVSQTLYGCLRMRNVSFNIGTS